MRTKLAAFFLGAVLLPACGSAASGGDGSPTIDAGSGAVDSGTANTATVDSSAPRDATQQQQANDSGGEVTTNPDGGADNSVPPSGDGGGGYGNNGPDGYTTASPSVTNGSSTFTLNLWIPNAPGMHPVVSFSPGLQQVSAGYGLYATRLATWGFVVLMRDDPGILTSGDVVVSDLTYTVGTWLPAQNTTSSSPLFGKVDLSHVGLAGHSRGGQSSLDAAEEGLHGKVQSWVGLDPVDTAYTAGTAPSTALPSIGIPTTYLGAGVPTNCAPTNDNFQVLYTVSPSPSVTVTFANASHTQFEDLSACPICGGLLCSPMGTANSTLVLDDAVRYLTAAFARDLLGDSSVGATFLGAGAAADESAGVISIVSK